MINIKKYTENDRIEWDFFVDSAKNSTFMFKRDYMDYHKDRFYDYSLMFYDNNKLIAIFPASLHGKEIRSHGGLSYGGIISDSKMTVQRMLDIFDTMKSYLQICDIKRIIYKRVPSIYYSYPSDEDLYALFINGANLYRRDISTTIYLSDKIRFNERRRRNLKKAIKSNVSLQKDNKNYNEFVLLLSDILKTHNAVPVHSLVEITNLASSFPDNIKLFTAHKDKKIISGVVIYETKFVAHAQYIASSMIGRDIGGLDFIFDYLINNYYREKKYFDFGISTENEGKYLNQGLVSQKQEFGGRGTIHDFYSLSL